MVLDTRSLVLHYKIFDAQHTIDITMNLKILSILLYYSTDYSLYSTDIHSKFLDFNETLNIERNTLHKIHTLVQYN